MIRPATPVTPADVAAHYDELDRFYRALWGEHVHHGYWIDGRETPEDAVRNLVDLAADRLALRPGERICDIGCGYGATARRLADRFGVEVVGVTLSAAQRAVSFGGGSSGDAANPTIVVGDWLANDFPDASFDAVLAIESSEHMPDLPHFFRETSRVLRPGGRILVCAWLSREDPPAWQERHLLEPICREGRLAALGTAQDYETLLRAAGFSAIRSEDLSRAVRRTWSICLRRLAAALATDAETRRFVRDRAQHNRVFALTLPRIWLAYRAGAMRYGLFTARKPG